jgi:lipopolysaccharide transport system permease protein
MKNPHQAQPTSLMALISSLIKNRHLIYQMTKREVIGRYKGSLFGILWSFFNPILMLAIYTFVFTVVFKARWGIVGDDSKWNFALMIFVGMIVFGVFSDAVNRAPTIIINNANYVKKVIFPLDILPVIGLGVSLFHALISLFVLVGVYSALNGYINWTSIFIPLIFLPLALLTLGISWLLASLGVYMRDVGQTITILISILIFLSPVFYPIDALPVEYQSWMMINPLSFIIEQARVVLILGKLPNWFGLMLYTIFSLFVTMLGFSWFQKTRKGFADVL